jgi:hypothetical protein
MHGDCICASLCGSGFTVSMSLRNVLTYKGTAEHIESARHEIANRQHNELAAAEYTPHGPSIGIRPWCLYRFLPEQTKPEITAP